MKHLPLALGLLAAAIYTAITLVGVISNLLGSHDIGSMP